MKAVLIPGECKQITEPTIDLIGIPVKVAAGLRALVGVVNSNHSDVSTEAVYRALVDAIPMKDQVFEVRGQGGRDVPTLNLKKRGTF